MKYELFPTTTFTTTELVELALEFNKPVVKKYLHMLAVTAVRDLAHGQRKAGESAESYLERQAVVSGGLAAIEQLLNIEAPATAF